MIINGMNYYANTLPTMSGIVDPAFKQIPKGTTCFLIWRIEKLQVVPLPKDQYGSFFNGDAYIVYSATEPGQPGGLSLKVKEAKALEQHIHFWLGTDVSQDEAGVAAYKSVELDDFLGGAPIQHRETEANESQRFRSYFTNGIRLLQGGVASGFNHVSKVFNPRLFAVKGKRRPVVRQCAKVSWAEMNSGDVFLLQLKEAVFIWEGKTANNMEKLSAAKVAQQLKAETGGFATIVFVEDGNEENLPEIERKVFESKLPLKERKLMRPATDFSDDQQEHKVGNQIKLYRCSDDEGTLRVTEVKTGPLLQQDLNSGDSFIIDNGSQGVWAWIGKKASPKERIEAMRNAQGFNVKKNYPPSTPVTRVIDGGEPEEFKSLFSRWKVKNETVGFGRQHSRGHVAQIVQTSFDATTLHEQPKMAARAQMLDDGSGRKEVYKIHNFELVEVPKDKHGSFFEHDCYVIKYSTLGPREHILVYYWLGSKATNEDRGAAALQTVALDDAVDGQAIQIRVIQGKEPPHFIAMFGGHMTVYLGDADDSGYEPVKPYLLQIRGGTPHEARAIQVPIRGASLNSNDVFLLVGKESTHLWCGKGCTGDEREIAKNIATRDRVDYATVYEGQEKADFWEAIGGKEDYASDAKLAVDDYKDAPPRLFQCSNATGNLKAEEIINFGQPDLVEDDVMLLDAGHTIFLWFGKDSNKDEQKGSVELAQNYLRTDPAGRHNDTGIQILKQGFEPPTFTGFFGFWDRSIWSENKSFAELKAELQLDQPILSVSALEVSHMNGADYKSSAKYPLETLIEKDAEKLPADVNPAHKEMHLSDADFQRIFKMDYKSFSDLPQWKKQQLKKGANLF